MEMEVDNPINDGGTDAIADKSEPSKEEDSIFEEMRNLVPDEDIQSKITIITESEILPKDDEPAAEKELEPDDYPADPNPQIQMEDLKVAEEEMNEVDVVVCGGCHSVYHFVEHLTRHKQQCTRKSSFRNNAIENKPQVWAFLLWKNAQAKHISRSGTVVEESSWKLYQKWCKMPDRIRNAWIAAGGAVMNYTTFGSKQASPPTPPPTSPPPIHNIYPKPAQKAVVERVRNGEAETKPVVLRKLVQRDHTGEIQEIRSTNDPPTPKPTTLKDEIENIRNQLEGNDTSANANAIGNGGTLREEEFVVEKIVSRRFNPKKKQYEYLLKWEGYPAEQNTWEPAENLETCQHLLKQFEESLAKQNLGKGKSMRKLADMTILPGPSSETHGRPVRHSKQKALNQVKQWCGSIRPDDIDDSVKRKYDIDSDDDDFLMKRLRMSDEHDSEDSLMAPPNNVVIHRTLLQQQQQQQPEEPPAKRRVGRPPKNRNLTNGIAPAVHQTMAAPPTVEPNLAAALGLESDSEDSPLAVLNQRAAATRVSNLSPINQQVLVANAKGVVKVDPSQVPNLTSGVYIMSNKSIVKLDSVTPSRALALKEHQINQQDSPPSKVEPQVVMIKNGGATPGQKTGIVRKNPGILKQNIGPGRPPRPQGSIRINTPGSRLQSGIVPRSSVTGVSSGIRPRGTVSNNRLPFQKKPEPDKKILIGSKSVGRGGLKSGIHRRSSITKAEDLESKLRDLKSGETADIFEDLPESESSESDHDMPDDFPKDIGPIEPASPPRPLTLCPLTGKVLSKAEGEKTPEPTPPPSPNNSVEGCEVVVKKDVRDHYVKLSSSHVTIPSQQNTTSSTAKALFVNTSSSGNAGGSGVGKPLFVNTSQSGVVNSATTSSGGQTVETILPDNEDEEDDMVTITGEDGLVYKVSNSDLGSLLGGEEGEQCVYVTEGDDGDAVLALQYQGGTALGSLASAASGALEAGSGLNTEEHQQFYIKQESVDSSDLVSLQQDSDEPQVIAQLVEASEPTSGGQRRVVLLLPDGNLMMTEVDEEQYAALELDK